VTGKELLEIMDSRGALPESEVCQIVKQILTGASHMHNQNIVHRDLKLENIMLDETMTRIKIIDFGFSTCLMPKDRKLKIVCGTPAYMAPEIVRKE